MDIDIGKYRKISSFANSDGDFERISLLNQTIEEFELYMQYAPNRHTVYINDNPNPIWAVFQDVSDLEIRTDSKWMLTSLKNKVNIGDIFSWGNRRWICIYDKEKNTGNCNKVKVQPCNYVIKLPYLDGNVAKIYNADSVIMTYLTDMKEFKQPMPSETGTSFVTVQFNDFTNKITRQDRIWLYNSAYEVSGVDFTNIDFYINKGFIKWTLRPDKSIEDLDNIELGICDYYKYFTKPVDDVIGGGSSVISITTASDKIECGKEILFTVGGVPQGDKIDFSFEGINLGCVIKPINNNSCILVTGKEIGFVKLKAMLINNNDAYDIKRIVIES